jgi:diguanylate cyclase (GGDEF)-like protein/PAS domain S-box-containing protein
MKDDDSQVPLHDATIIDGGIDAFARGDDNGVEAGEPAAAPPQARPAPESAAPAVAKAVEPGIAHMPLLAARAFEYSGYGMYVTDQNDRIVLVNRAFCALTGLGHEQVVGKEPGTLAAEHHAPQLSEEIRDALRQAGEWQGEVWHRRHDGTSLPVLLTVRAVRDAGGRVLSSVGTLSDISAYKHNEDELRRLAQHDPLTGLANRSLLLDRLNQAIASSRRSHTRLAVLFLDFDRFKNINDSLGHPVGDELLRRAAARLKGCVRSEDTVARLGGDEFVVILLNIADASGAAQVALKIGHRLFGPHRIERHELTITTSIGISVFPDDGTDANTLIQHADTALYRAKEHGRNRYVFYQQEMTTQAKERLLMEHSLRHALQCEEFVLHYQPLVDIADGRIVGAEALIRWQHPHLGLISPERFIPVSEESGLIRQIGPWVLRSVGAAVRNWRDAGLPRLRIATNLSPKQIVRPQHTDALCAAIAAAGLPLEGMDFEIEITESSLLTGEQTVVAAKALKALGVHLAIDDFGTGYSSMAALKELPIDCLKIDASFIRRVPMDPSDTAITTAIVAMGKALGLRITAEGVETREQLEFLRRIGCDEAQGMLFSPPLPFDALRELILARPSLLPE